MAVIGVFDSGSGGLSVLREIRKILPDERFIYYSDNAHCPYGEKSASYIIERGRAITDLLLSKGAEAVVVACNTATAAAISTLRAEYSVPFVGMEPAVKPAATGTRSGVVGVLATAGTLKAPKYLNTKGQYADAVRIVERRAEAELKQVKAGHPFLVFSSVALLALVSFAGGMLLGISVNEGRHQRQREARLKEALSQLSGFAGTSVTNATALPANMLTPEQRRNVSVVVFQ